MSNYIFSVCIPVYNTEQYLHRALDSILNQTFKVDKIETVVVNDGSPCTEDCTRIVSGYSNRLSIQYIKKDKNEGLFLARKTAVEKANGKYLLFLDADDTFELYALKTLSDCLNEDVDYIQFRIYEVVGTKKSLHPALWESEVHKTIDDVLQDKVMHNVANKCYNTQVLKKIYQKIPDCYAVYAEDYYQSAIIEYFSQKKKFIDIPLYDYFRYIGITSDNTFQHKNNVARIMDSFRNIERNLICFFESRGESQYVQHVRNCIAELYHHLSYRTNSITVVMFIMCELPEEYYSLRLKIFVGFCIHIVNNFWYAFKRIVKNLLPYGIVQFICEKKHKIK